MADCVLFAQTTSINCGGVGGRAQLVTMTDQPYLILSTVGAEGLEVVVVVGSSLVAQEGAQASGNFPEYFAQ